MRVQVSARSRGSWRFLSSPRLLHRTGSSSQGVRQHACTRAVVLAQGLGLRSPHTAYAGQVRALGVEVGLPERSQLRIADPAEQALGRRVVLGPESQVPPRQEVDVARPAGVLAVLARLLLDHQRAVVVGLVVGTHAEERPGLAEVHAHRTVIQAGARAIGARTDQFEVRAGRERYEGDEDGDLADVRRSHLSLRGAWWSRIHLRGSVDERNFGLGDRGPSAAAAQLCWYPPSTTKSAPTT